MINLDIRSSVPYFYDLVGAGDSLGENKAVIFGAEIV